MMVYMSTQFATETETDNQPTGFAEASAKRMPTLICVGTVGEVGEGHLSKPNEDGVSNYIVQPISIEPLDAGRSTKVQLLYRPNWFVPGFQPETLKELDGGEGMHFVYGRNINSRGSISVLRGLTGSPETFKDLAVQLLSLDVPQGADGPSIEDVQKTLTDFFEGNVDASGEKVKFIYELRQQYTKTNELNAEGKPIYLAENRYQLQQIMDFNEKNLKSQRIRAEKSQGNTKFTYEGVPY
jgi:hypothetical protein